MQQFDVFISYRREGAEYLAHNLYERLREQGFSVFQDIESLRSGKFNTALYDVIASCKDVILVLPPHGMDRCVDEEDWVRKEISFALKKEKHIVPILMPGFEWPEELPAEINEIRNFNGLTSSTEYFDAFIEKLADFLISSRNPDQARPQKHRLRVILAFSIYAIGLGSPLICLFHRGISFSLLPRVLYFLWIVLGALWIWNGIETRPQFAAMCFGTIQEEEFDLTPAQLFSRVVGAFDKEILISTDVPDGFVSYYRLRRLEFGSWDGRRTNYLKIFFRRTLERYDPSVLYLHNLSRSGQAVKMLIRQGFVLQPVPDFADFQAEYLSKNTLHVFLYYRKRKLDHVMIYHCTLNELKEHFQGGQDNEA